MYRKDLTPTAPASYDDVLTNATAQNKSNVAGYLIRGKATNPVVADFLPILWSFGGDVFDDNWNVVFDNAASLSAVQFLVDKLKPVAQADPANTDASDRDRLMAVGQGYQSSTWPGEINTAVLGPGTTVKDKVAFIPIPKGPSGKGVGMMGNWMLGIPKASKNQQPAADFIKWMLQADTQKTYAQNNGIPSRTSVLKDASLQAANPYFSGARGCLPGAAELAAAHGPVERGGDHHRNRAECRARRARRPHRTWCPRPRARSGRS